MQDRLNHLEAFTVLATLAVAACAGGGMVADWLTAGAVFLSFLCTQCAFDMADSHAGNEALSNVGRRYRILYITKELFWVSSCIALGNAPLIVSTVIFGFYPLWRKAARAARLIAPSKVCPVRVSA